MIVKDKILESILPVVGNSRYVSTDMDGVRRFAKKIFSTEIPDWDNELQLLSTEEETVQYYFFIDSTQGCTWPAAGKERWHFKIGDEWVKGYYAFAYAIKQAALKDKKYLDAEYLSNISFEDFLEIFQGKGELQLMKERQRSLKENFTILKEKYDGQAGNLVKAANKDVSALVYKIVKEFPSFDDKAMFNGKEVYFWKRAQIFPNDIYFALNGKGLGEFTNMDDLSIFADYKIPQLLEDEGVIKYNDELLEKIKHEELLPFGSMEEIEIRAHIIHASELIKKELKTLGREITSQQLDWILWNLTQKREFKLPHHRTITIFY